MREWESKVGESNISPEGEEFLELFVNIFDPARLNSPNLSSLSVQ